MTDHTKESTNEWLNLRRTSRKKQGASSKKWPNYMPHQCTDEPNTFAVAEKNPCWLKAMQEEMTSITENQTWSLEDMPPGHRTIRGSNGSSN